MADAGTAQPGAVAADTVRRRTGHDRGCLGIGVEDLMPLGGPSAGFVEYTRHDSKCAAAFLPCVRHSTAATGSATSVLRRHSICVQRCEQMRNSVWREDRAPPRWRLDATEASQDKVDRQGAVWVPAQFQRAINGEFNHWLAIRHTAQPLCWFRFFRHENITFVSNFNQLYVIDLRRQ